MEAFDVDKRRPRYAEMVRLAPTADHAYEIAGDIALQDSLDSINVSEMDPETKRLWVLNMGRLGQELVMAEELLLEGVARRPGWAYHRSLLGMIDFVRRSGSPPGSRWLETLEKAIRLSPGDVSIASFAASALISSWDDLEPDTRTGAPPIFRMALQDAGFVSRNFVTIGELLGVPEASALLPASTEVLKAALDAYVESGDAVLAAPLYVRWEKAEWRERQHGLTAILERLRLNDLSGARDMCGYWVYQHSPYAFDTGAGKAQVARVLELWPRERGSWESDHRAELIRYFLNGRLEHIEPAVMAEAAGSLAEVPAPIAARLALGAGDEYAAETLAGSAQAERAFDWTPFFVDLARYYLENKEPEKASAVLDRFAPAAADECEVALVRREIGRWLGEPSEIPSGLLLSDYPTPFWAEAGVPICIDPLSGFEGLSVELEVLGSPALIELGFDGGRSQTRLLPPGRSTHKLPLEGRSGRHYFQFNVVTGGSALPIRAFLR